MPTSPLRAAAAAALLLLTACAGTIRPTTGLHCEVDGRTRWARYETPHTTLVTELDEPVARDLARAMEFGHQALRATSFKNLPPTRLSVLAIPFDLPGYAWYTTRNVANLAERFAFGFAGLDDDSARVFLQIRAADPRGNVGKPPVLTAKERMYALHLVTHVLAGMAIPSRPPWLAKGLASYFQDVRVENGRVWVGITNAEVLDLEPYAQKFTLRELLALRPCDLENLDELGNGKWAALDYQSWLLFHYLATNRKAGLADFLARMVAGEASEEAWRRAFPDLAPDRPGALDGLERELARYGRQGKYMAAGYEAAVEPFEVTRTPLACTDARVARIGLFSELGARNPLDHEAGQLLAEVPGQPDALLARAELAPAAERAPLLRGALAAAPGSAKGWSLLAEVLPPGDERAQAASRASELGEGIPAVETRVAEVRLDAGATDEAVARARGVLTALPWSVRARAVLARGLARQGKCAEARAELTKLERCYADRCPDRVPKPQEPRRLRELPTVQVEAAKAEVTACTAR